jgi:hypothetical protein
MLGLGIKTYNTTQPLPMSTVASVIFEGATAWTFQRKSFYFNGRFWVFWSNGRQAAGDFNILYATSTDGIIWTIPTVIRPCINSTYFSIWFDNTYMHYAYANQTSLYYRRGIPNSDGTITWSAVEQTVSTTYNKADFPMISVDSNGYVWIGYKDQTGTSHYTYVIKSGNNNGTWGSTPAGFPYRFSTNSYSQSKTAVIPLTFGKILAVYYTNLNGTLKARCWDSTAWRTERILSVPYNGWAHSEVAEGDDVHLTFLKKTPNNIIYNKYSYATDTWSIDEIIQSGTTTTSDPCLCIDISSNNLYCFWFKSPNLTHIYYKKKVGGIWDVNPIDWITDNLTPFDNRINCFDKSYSGKIGVIYCSEIVTPFNVRFAYLTI